MADEIQSLPQVAPTAQVNNKITEPNAPKPKYTNDGPTTGNPTIPAGARSITNNTGVGYANDHLSHVCDFVSEMQKNINLKKYTKAIAKQIRDAIRAVLRALGLGDPTGEVSWLANTLKSIAREVNRINKEILQPILEFEKYVIAYIAKLRAILAWILSLPAKFLAMLQDCLARVIKLIGAVFSDIGAGLKEGFSEGPSDYEDIIKEAKNLANEASTAVKLSVAAVAGAANIAGAATLGLLVPTSQAELDAANATITAYEAPAKPAAQNKNAP